MRAVGYMGKSLRVYLADSKGLANSCQLLPRRCRDKPAPTWWKAYRGIGWELC